MEIQNDCNAVYRSLKIGEKWIVKQLVKVHNVPDKPEVRLSRKGIITILVVIVGIVLLSVYGFDCGHEPNGESQVNEVNEMLGMSSNDEATSQVKSSQVKSSQVKSSQVQRQTLTLDFSQVTTS